MLIEIQLLLLSFRCICCRDVDIIFKLDSKHLIDSLTSETSVKYLTELAQAFAKKAAETFINEIKNKTHLFTKNQVIRPKPIKVDRVQDFVRPYEEKNILDEEEAFKLLEKPSPDGDNLDWHAPQDLTKEDTQDSSIKKGIPVYRLKKVNGGVVRHILVHFQDVTVRDNDLFTKIGLKQPCYRQLDLLGKLGNSRFKETRDVDIIFKLDSKHLIDSLTSETSVKYLTELAQAFAKKAAETFINEIKNKTHLFTKNQVIRPKPIKVDRVQDFVRPYEEKNILDEEEAFKLLEKPSPDGDNLDWHAPQDLTKEDTQDSSIKKGIPVYRLKKVNGIYVRRYLGILR